jgi:hypothetical protein
MNEFSIGVRYDCTHALGPRIKVSFTFFSERDFQNLETSNVKRDGSRERRMTMSGRAIQSGRLRQTILRIGRDSRRHAATAPAER